MRMQRVLLAAQIAEVKENLDEKVLRYLGEGQIETFESFEHFNIIAFDWYDISSASEDTPKMMIYQDAEDLFFFCEDEWMRERATSVIRLETEDAPLDNQQLLYRFFVRLLKGDTAHLDATETEITDTEDEMLSGVKKHYLGKIVEHRKELLRLKRYYEQLDSIFDELTANDNGLLSRDSVRRFRILDARVERCAGDVLNLREYVTQMREAYQSQIDIQQNELMKVFTVVTVIFLPLTLLVGWYGMNFRMPELEWTYGYPVMIGICVALVVWLLVIFKKKKWL
jgi:magnesium transporter